MKDFSTIAADYIFFEVAVIIARPFRYKTTVYTSANSFFRHQTTVRVSANYGFRYKTTVRASANYGLDIRPEFALVETLV